MTLSSLVGCISPQNPEPSPMPSFIESNVKSADAIQELMIAYHKSPNVNYLPEMIRQIDYWLTHSTVTQDAVPEVLFFFITIFQNHPEAIAPCADAIFALDAADAGQSVFCNAMAFCSANASRRALAQWLRTHPETWDHINVQNIQVQDITEGKMKAPEQIRACLAAYLAGNELRYLQAALDCATNPTSPYADDAVFNLINLAQQAPRIKQELRLLLYYTDEASRTTFGKDLSDAYRIDYLGR